MAFITDILDGYYARKYRAVTTLGKFLDPLADKILVTITMIMLIPLGRIPVLDCHCHNSPRNGGDRVKEHRR